MADIMQESSAVIPAGGVQERERLIRHRRRLWGQAERFVRDHGILPPLSRAELLSEFGADPQALDQLIDQSVAQFGSFVRRTADGLEITPEGRPLTRMVAAVFDEYAMDKTGHSSAV